MDKITATYINDFLTWINENLEVKQEDYEHYGNCMMNCQTKLQDEINEPKVFGVVAHADHGSAALNEAITKLHGMGKEVNIIATDEINPRPRLIESELMESKPFIIEKFPELQEPFFEKAKHQQKGHERPFKYHG